MTSTVAVLTVGVVPHVAHAQEHVEAPSGATDHARVGEDQRPNEHAAEEEPADHHAHLGPKNPTELGLAGVALAEFPNGAASETGIGVGFAVSHDFWSHTGVELAVHVLSTEVREGAEAGAAPTRRTTVPVDVLLRRSFHASIHVHPYVSLGATIIFGSGDVHVGLATALGSNYWFSHNLGLFLEANVNLVARDGVEPELGAAFGPAVRF